jgi:FG-GAP-like repeat
VDLDGDGVPDVISGSFPGELYLFRGLGHGRFAARETIKGRDGAPINVGGASTVFAADWQGHGRFDLIVGTIDGKVYLIPNEGTPTHHVFGMPRRLEVDGKPIELSEGDVHPVVADWDRDGKPDLLVGTGSGSVVWYRNVGSLTEPRLTTPAMLVPASAAAKESRARLKEGQWGIRAKICVTDWNGDGWPDLLLGDYSYVVGVQAKRRDVNPAEQQKAARGWQRLTAEYLDASQDLLGLQETPRQVRQDHTQARENELRLCQTRVARLERELARAQKWLEMERPSTQAHGYVWLFLRRPPRSTTR